jgi:hypothetical protein
MRGRMNGWEGLCRDGGHAVAARQRTANSPLTRPLALTSASREKHHYGSRCLSGKSRMGLVQCVRQKYSASELTQITRRTPAIPHPQEGRIAIVTDVGRGMRWTRQRRARTGSQGGLRLVSDRPARRRPALKRLRRNFGQQHMSRSMRFGRGSRVRQKRVVLAPVAGVKLMEIFWAQPGVGKSPIRQRRRPKEFGSGESALYALKPLRREGRVFRRTLRSPVCILCARSRVLRAPGFPCALFDFEGTADRIPPGASRRENAMVCPAVIASEAKQSISQYGDRWIASSLRSSQ